jgi:hypothetical protein
MATRHTLLKQWRLTNCDVWWEPWLPVGCLSRKQKTCLWPATSSWQALPLLL